MHADDASEHSRNSGKSREAFRTISEVAEDLDLPQHVLRFWESKFSQVRPLKRGGNRRYYRPDDVRTLKAIKQLLHSDGYTIRGVQNLFRAQGLKATISQALELDGATGVGVSEESAEAAPAPVEGKPKETVVTLQPSRFPTDELVNILGRLKALRAALG